MLRWFCQRIKANNRQKMITGEHVQFPVMDQSLTRYPSASPGLVPGPEEADMLQSVPKC